MSKSTKKTKKYNYVVRTLTLPDGKRKYVYGKNKADAEAQLAELKTQLAGGVDINDDTTCGEITKVWLEKYKAPYVRPSTVFNIRSRLNKYFMPRFATIRVKDVTSLMIQDFIAEAATNGYSAVAQMITHLREIFDLAIDLGCIARSPVPKSLKAPKRPKTPEKEVVPFEVESYLKERLKPVTDERMMFLAGRYLGLRRGEIMALNWDSIDLENGRLYVCRSVVVDDFGHTYFSNLLKSEDGRRELPIPLRLQKELRLWFDFYGTDRNSRCDNSNGFLFCREDGRSCSVTQIAKMWERVRRLASQVDEEYAKKMTLHTLRHTFITRLFEAGFDIKEVQELAGHKEAMVTFNTYTHFDKRARKADTFARVVKTFED